MKMADKIKSLEVENKELRIAKNMLIDQVEAQEGRLQEQDAQIEEMENEISRLQSQIQNRDKEDEKPDTEQGHPKVLDKIRFFFYCVENFLYKSWLAVWIAMIAVILYRFLTGPLA